LIYHLHEVRDAALAVTPFADVVEKGVFATRAPSRPNPIGLSVVKLARIDGLVLHVDNLDVLDGTPLLDIKLISPSLTTKQRSRVDGSRMLKRKTNPRSQTPASSD